MTTTARATKTMRVARAMVMAATVTMSMRGITVAAMTANGNKDSASPNSTTINLRQ
jgi:hypothetical protein